MGALFSLPRLVLAWLPTGQAELLGQRIQVARHSHAIRRVIGELVVLLGRARAQEAERREASGCVLPSR